MYDAIQNVCNRITRVHTDDAWDKPLTSVTSKGLMDFGAMGSAVWGGCKRNIIYHLIRINIKSTKKKIQNEA
jgi:hypothetical protein